MSSAELGTKSGISKVWTRCNLCGADDYKLITQGREHEYDNTTDDIFNVVECNKCALVYLNPRPDISELSTIYPLNYYSYNQKALREQANPNSILHKLRYKGFTAKINKSLGMCTFAQPPFKVLDIGCGDGHTLDLYRHGQSVETHGVDFNADALALAARNGHKVYAGRFEDVNLPVEYFDLVTASHVIEHVPDPKEFAAKAFSILKPGGILWMETPNIGSIDAHWFKDRYWGAYHFPRHWYFFTKSTIKKLGQSVGFNIEMVDFVPNAIFWYWTFHSMILDQYPESRRVADAILPPVDFQKIHWPISYAFAFSARSMWQLKNAQERQPI